MIGYIKKTGSFQDIVELTYSYENIKFYIGEEFIERYLTKEFERKNIISFINSKGEELNLEPNIFVVDYENEIHCSEVIRGNILFLKKENNNYIDLTNDDIKFIKDYISTVLMSDQEKSMIGLFDYDAKFVGMKYNK